jgi:hypothetical protein
MINRFRTLAAVVSALLTAGLFVCLDIVLSQVAPPDAVKQICAASVPPVPACGPTFGFSSNHIHGPRASALFLDTDAFVHSDVDNYLERSTP